MIKRMFPALLLLLATVGCIEDLEKLAGTDVPKEAKFVITFNDIVKWPRGDNSIEKPLNTIDGRRVIVNAIPYMSSINVSEIAATPVPGREGYYYLRLKPDQRGRTMWLQIAVQFRNTPIAMLIDGSYYAEFTPPQFEEGNDEWIHLPVPVDAVMADYIVKYARDNYRYFNKNSKRENNF